MTALNLALFGTLAAAGSALNLLPQPASIRMDEGSFSFPEKQVFRVSKDAEKVARTSVQHAATAALKRRIIIEADLPGKWRLASSEAAGMLGSFSSIHGTEAYRLKIMPSGVVLAASDEAGFRHGLRTLFQLIGVGKSVPACEIEDRPALGVRGIMIDMVRLKERDEVYFRLLDEMAAWKMNALFLHFTDKQGCSIELRSHPEVVGRHAMSQATLAKLISHADELGIRVIPEIEAWGHANWLTGPHPELAEENSSSLCLAREEMYPILEDIIREVAHLFPDRYLHIGCDEAVFGRDDACRARMESVGADRMISDHINRLNRIVRRYGKTSIIWGDIVLKRNEVLRMLDKDIVVEDWVYSADVKPDGLIKLRKEGFKTLAAPSLMWGGWRLCVAREHLTNIGNFSKYAASAEAEGVVTTIWYPQRYVAGSLGPGIAWAADQAWAPGGRSIEAVMAAYLKQRFGLDPTKERVDRALKLWDLGQREGSISAGCWPAASRLADRISPEGRKQDEDYFRTVSGLSEALKRDLPEVKFNREDYQSLIVAAQAAEHVALRRKTGGSVADLLQKAVEALGKGNEASARVSLLEAARQIRDIETRRKEVLAGILDLWDRDRYPDDPERIMEDPGNTLMPWFGSQKIFREVEALADRLEALATKPDRAEIEALLH